MALTIRQQIERHFQGCHSALIVIPEMPSIDAISSALVIQHILQKLGKDVATVSWGYQIPEKLSFFPEINSIKPDMALAQKTIIQIDTEKHPISDISYHQKDNHLQILVSPKNQTLPKDAITVQQAAHAYDLIIAINTTELETLGHLYSKHQAFFDETTIINIDHRPDNEHYGQINWIDINASSTAEMIFSMFYQQASPSPDIATTLLTGMMDETHSFRSHNVKPKTLQIVSLLLQSGANHESIVNNLYRTKTVGLLKLWGYVLDNLSADRELSLAWSVIPNSIFTSTGTDHRQLQDLMNEILSHSPEAKTVVLFIEHKSEDPFVEIQVQTTPPLHAKELIKNWQPFGSERNANAKVANANLADTEKEVIRVIKERLSSFSR